MLVKYLWDDKGGTYLRSVDVALRRYLRESEIRDSKRSTVLLRYGTDGELVTAASRSRSPRLCRAFRVPRAYNVSRGERRIRVKRETLLGWKGGN